MLELRGFDEKTSRIRERVKFKVLLELLFPGVNVGTVY